MFLFQYIEFYIKQSKIPLIKFMRQSRLSATFLFMFFNAAVMYGMSKTQKHRFWWVFLKLWEWKVNILEIMNDGDTWPEVVDGWVKYIIFSLSRVISPGNLKKAKPEDLEEITAKPSWLFDKILPTNSLHCLHKHLTCDDYLKKVIEYTL